MNVRDVLLDSLMSAVEEDQELQSIEHDIVDEILASIRSIKQTIQLNKDSLT